MCTRRKRQIEEKKITINMAIVITNGLKREEYFNSIIQTPPILANQIKISIHTRF